MINFDKFSELFDDRLDYAVNSNFPHELVSIFSSEVETTIKGSNAWVVTGFKKPKDGYGQGHGKTIPTEHQSYSARTGAGALDKDGTEDNQMVNQSGGATTSDLRTISPIRSRTDVGASDKASDDDMAKSKDLTIPTHIKPTLHRQDVGASDKSKDLVANMVATDFANDELTSNRSHKVSIDSLIQDI